MGLADGQWSYQGLTFGDGTLFFINKVEGFEGYETRSSDSDQPRGDGAIRGLDYVGARTVSFELAIIEFEDIDGSVYEGMWSDLRTTFAAARDTDSPLTFKRPGQPERVINCRPIQITRSEAFLNYNRFGFPPVVLRAVDPRLYSSAIYSDNCLVYAGSKGGADFVWNFGVDFTGGVQNELVAVNNGTADAYPLIRFYGPISGTCTGVTLTNTTNGDVFDINTTISSGQILTADMGAAVTGSNSLIISLGGSSRYGSWTLPRSAFRLSPGSNTIRLQVDGTSTDVVANLTWRDTWMG
jgi:hypothetical protein